MAKKKRKMTIADLDQYADVGMSVRYYPQADETGFVYTGYVTGRGHGTSLTVNVLSPHTMGTAPMDGVKHMDDPAARTADLAEQGGWRHVPMTLAMLRMLMVHDIIRWGEDRAGNPVLEVVPDGDAPPAADPDPAATPGGPAAPPLT